MSGAFARTRIGDARQGAVERAVKSAAQRLLAREISINEALAVVGVALSAPEERKATPRELAASCRHAHRQGVVAEIVQLESEGRGRASALSIVVTRHVKDRFDPIEVESLTRKFRRWRSAEKSDTCPGSVSKSD
jgi:hypothetical protein